MFNDSNDVKFPFDIKIIAPIKPIEIPIYCNMLGLFLKTKTPTSRTKKGDNPFKIPAKELDILVSDKENRIAGIKFPINPHTIKYRTFFLFTNLRFLIDSGNNIKKLKKIRAAPT